ncbi:MAG: ATP-binding protein [Myxococcales bacterium]|nr:ATP-binding protein [Myxococcales bacterium]
MEPAPLAVADALDQLVHQFADPLAFFRELIQNALDAGSHEVEVWLDFDAGSEDGEDDPEGVAIWRIEDWGEGMTRAIIERRLTRLFSSAKAEDRTKIGKFGIGFVSVFAIGPRAVVVDTSREGESWRVIFGQDTRYELRALPAAVDGTKIRILRPMRRSQHAEYAARAREVIAFWCRHCEGEIRVDGAPINRPLDLDLDLKVRERSALGEIIVGHPGDGSTFFGLYNRGLTLLEGAHEPALRGLHVKASSPLVEHTLTRDNVIRDRSYERLIEAIVALARGPLCTRVIEAIAGAQERGERVSAELYRALAWHVASGQTIDDELLARPILRAASGGLVSLGELQRALGSRRRPLTAPAPTPLTAALEARGHLVLLASADAPIGPLVSALGGIEAASARWCMALPTGEGRAERRWGPLLEATGALLRGRAGARIGELAVGRFDYPDSAIAGRAAIAADKAFEPCLIEQVDEVSASIFSGRRALVVNADHPSVAALAEVAEREPEHAAYVLAKLFLLAGGRLDGAIDGELLTQALELRCRRLTG